MKLSIALVQQVCEKGAIDHNLGFSVAAIRDAAARGVDIMAFPEANLTGYVETDRYPRAPIAVDSAPVRHLIAATRGLPVTALPGLVELNPAGPPYLTQLVIRNGELLGAYRKRTILDDELGLFTPGTAAKVFRHGEIAFGIAICADLGSEQVYADAAQRGARIVFEVAAPGLYGEQSTRNWQSGFEWWEGECSKYLTAYSQTHGIWVAVATQAGRTVDEDFPGGAYVFAPSGERLFATPDWSPGIVSLTLDLDAKAIFPLA
ncbi:MAG: carbon-nitrogen hydrolase family protein [Anaerolineae bacterium]|nr:carbon-nitrogen hydrolase family protein [Anaerolineae bacterium]